MNERHFLPYPAPPKLLVISDTKRQGIDIAVSLEEKGYIVDRARNASEASRLARAGAVDAVVLDVDEILEDAVSGLMDSMRSDWQFRSPVLALFPVPTLAQKIEAFEAGLDDVVCKPCAASELDARLKALIRRARSEVAASRLRVGGLQFDLRTGTLTRHGKHVHVPPTGMKILATLMHRSPRIVPRSELLRELWGAHEPKSDSLKSHICTLRKRLGRCSTFELQTVSQSGYRIVQ